MNFRRYYLPNSIVFITNFVNNREPIFAESVYVNLFRETLRTVKALHPFQMIAYVLLPNHNHLLIRPTGPSNFSRIMQSAKSYFTYAYKQVRGLDGRLQFWQKRFHDHIIRDATDLERHLHYIHYNPVKHRLATRPEEWPHSSFLDWKQKGAYPDQWGWTLPDVLSTFTTDDVDDGSLF